jgi:hypothetical protein
LNNFLNKKAHHRMGEASLRVLASLPGLRLSTAALDPSQIVPLQGAQGPGKPSKLLISCTAGNSNPLPYLTDDGSSEGAGAADLGLPQVQALDYTLLARTMAGWLLMDSGHSGVSR